MSLLHMLAISVIAWAESRDAEVGPRLAEGGADAVEIVPGRLAAVTAEGTWFGRPVVAMQSLLFGQDGLRLFGSAEEREALIAAVAERLRQAGGRGIPVCVFGSPRNRRRDGLSLAEAKPVALEAFGRLAAVAQAAGTWLALEANPPEYGCDFVTSTAAAAALVNGVDADGFGLHVDAGGIALAHEAEVAPLVKTLSSVGDRLRHVHISEPFLTPVGSRGRSGDSDTVHAAVAESLRQVGYSRSMSIEMKPPAAPVVPPADPDEPWRTALSYARRVYNSI